VLLRSQARRIAVGRLEPETDHAAARYFIVTAGAGGDAHMLYSLNFELKQRHGMNAYYAQAAHIFLTHDFPAFLVEFDDEQSGERRSEVVSQVLAVRISNFGGLIRGLAPGATLERDDMRLVLFRTPRKSSFLFYLLGRMLERKWLAPGVELVWAHDAVCRPLPLETKLDRPWPRQNKAARIYAEADGELSGGLPVRLSSVPDALTLLVPSF
jgi:diacylglycerol kinase family enzyme